MSNLRDITSELSGLQLLDDAELDVTWNYINNLVNSREMLLFALTKVSSIPMIDYFAETEPGSNKKVFEEFGLTLENAKEIQSLNIDLLNIQRLLQIYCTEMYTILSLCGNLIDDEIDNIVKEKSEQDIDSFMRTVEAFTQMEGGIQTGGAPIDSYKNMLKILILLLLFIPVQSTEISPEVSNELQIVGDKSNPYNPYHTMVLSAKEDTYVTELENLNYQQKSVDVSRTIVVYDDEIKVKHNTMVGKLMKLITDVDPSGKEMIKNMVNNVNKQLRFFSNDVERNCVELMKSAYDKGIFASWKTLDDLEATKEKLKKTEELVEKQNSQKLVEAGSSVAAGAAHALTGDFFSAGTYLAFAGESVLGLLSSTKSKIEAIEKAESVQPYEKISAQEKKLYEDNSYKYSKLFCHYGYNLQLGFDETNGTLNVYGGKVNYESLGNLIHTLDENLKTKIITLTADVENDETKKMELQMTISTSQRLVILGEITKKLADIIDFSFKTHIVNLQRFQVSKDTIGEVKNYFDEQLNDLELLLMKLKELFPKRREMIEEKRKYTENEMVLKRLEQQTKDFELMANAELRAHESESYSRDVESRMNATASYFKSWTRIVETYIESGGSLVETAVSGLTKQTVDTVFKIPKEVIFSGVDVSDKIFWKTIKTVPGFIALSVPLYLFAIKMGAALKMIMTFVWGGATFLCIQLGNIVSVFKLFKTPFGYVLRMVKVFVVFVGQKVGQKITQMFTRNGRAPAEVMELTEHAEATEPTEQVEYREPTEPVEYREPMQLEPMQVEEVQETAMVPRIRSIIPRARSMFNELKPTKPVFPALPAIRPTSFMSSPVTFNNPQIGYTSPPVQPLDEENEEDAADALLRLGAPEENLGIRGQAERSVTGKLGSLNLFGGKNKSTKRHNKKNKRTKRHKHNKHKKTKNRVKKHKKTISKS